MGLNFMIFILHDDVYTHDELVKGMAMGGWDEEERLWMLLNPFTVSRRIVFRWWNR